MKRTTTAHDVWSKFTNRGDMYFWELVANSFAGPSNLKFPMGHEMEPCRWLIVQILSTVRNYI